MAMLKKETGKYTEIRCYLTEFFYENAFSRSDIKLAEAPGICKACSRALYILKTTFIFRLNLQKSYIYIFPVDHFPQVDLLFVYQNQTEVVK